MSRTTGIFSLVMILLLTTNGNLLNYPADGYSTTGIRRLDRLRLILADSLRGTKPPIGGRKSLADIRLHLTGKRGDSLDVFPAPDPGLQRKIAAIFPNRDASYSLALLDITPGRQIRYAERKPYQQLAPGSVGKLAIAAGLFTELAHLFPDDTLKRQAILKSRIFAGGNWVKENHHEVPFYDPGTRKYASRIVQPEDVFSLYEWADHMISASSNAAASVVWKELLLMRHFGSAYPPSLEEETKYFAETKPSESARIAGELVNQPLQKIGIIEQEWRLGSFFTATGKRRVPVTGGSIATPAGYLKFLVAMERGKIVDHWSSLEIKRLMYMTARRIRYSSSPALEKAAVFYKSGSLYRCKQEADFTCTKYAGNVENVMNSVAIVEHPSGQVYLACLMSNILRVNSAVEHQTLATYIDRALGK